MFFVAGELFDFEFTPVRDPAEIDPDAFEHEAMDELGMPRQIPMRHQPTQSGHIFSGEGYSAGHYGYMSSSLL